MFTLRKRFLVFLFGNLFCSVCSSVHNFLPDVTYNYETPNSMAQSAGTAEHTDCISAEGQDSPKGCPVFETEQSDGEAPVILKLWGNTEYPFTAIAPMFNLDRSGRTRYGLINGLNRIVYLY